MGVRATADLIMEEKPDNVIVGTGGVTLTPDILGVDKTNVASALDILSDRKKTGEYVVVAGGGFVGCEVANFLAQQNKKVTIVEMLDTVGLDMDSWIWVCLSAELTQNNVKFLKSTKIEEITDEGVTVIDKSWNKAFLKADNVVLALGFKPLDSLVKELDGKVKKISVIGDAKQPRRIQEAIYEGFLSAYNC